MSVPFNMVPDLRGQNSFGILFTTDNKQANLTANSNQTITVPSNFTHWVAVFAYSTSGVDVWVANNTTATVPSGGTFNSTASQLNPDVRQVEKGDVLNFITGNTNALVGVTFYALS